MAAISVQHTVREISKAWSEPGNFESKLRAAVFCYLHIRAHQTRLLPNNIETRRGPVLRINLLWEAYPTIFNLQHPPIQAPGL